MKPVRQKNSLVSAFSLVTALSILERGLGFLYRVVLSRLIGAEGVGMYQIALSVFSLFLTLTAGGLPITLSRFIAKNNAENRPLENRKTLSAGFFIVLCSTLPLLLFLYPLAPKLTFLFSDARCVPVFRVMIIGLVFCSLCSLFRGNFWGEQNFTAPAVLELTQEIVCVLAGVLLIKNASDATSGAIKAGGALTLSYIVVFFLSVCYFFIKGGRFSKPKNQLKPLFVSTLPVTCVRAGSSLVTSAVAVLLPAMLIKSGATPSQALHDYGVLTGMVMPVLFIPATLIGSLALVLVPRLSETYYKKDVQALERNLYRGLLFSFLLPCMLTPFFVALGSHLGLLAFASADAGKYILSGCWILLPMSVTMITTSMLNSIGFEKQTFIYYFIGAGITLLCILILPALVGAYAYILGMGLSYFATAVCNLFLLGKKCNGFFKRYGKRLGFFVLRVAVALLPLTLFCRFARNIFSRYFSALPCVLLTFLSGIIVSVLTYYALGLFPPLKRKKREVL